jgi:hypothetical protein
VVEVVVKKPELLVVVVQVAVEQEEIQEPLEMLIPEVVAVPVDSMSHLDQAAQAALAL